MNNNKVINMIPSRTLKEHLIMEKIEFTPVEEVTLIRHSFKDISKKEKLFKEYSCSSDSEVSELALKLLEEINRFNSIIHNNTGGYRLIIRDLKIACNDIKLVKNCLKNMEEERPYKIYAEKSDGNLACQFWMTKKGKIIHYELADMQPVVSIFSLDFKSLPFDKKQLVKMVDTIYENKNKLYVCLKSNEDGGCSTIPVAEFNDYMENHVENEEKLKISYVSPFIIEVE